MTERIEPRGIHNDNRQMEPWLRLCKKWEATLLETMGEEKADTYVRHLTYIMYHFGLSPAQFSDFVDNIILPEAMEDYDRENNA